MSMMFLCDVVDESHKGLIFFIYKTERIEEKMSERARNHKIICCFSRRTVSLLEIYSFFDRGSLHNIHIH